MREQEGRLKALKGFTPYELIYPCWSSQPQRFTLNRLDQMPGLNTKARTVPSLTNAKV